MKINFVTEKRLKLFELTSVSKTQCQAHKKLIYIRNYVQLGADKSESWPWYRKTGEYHPTIEGWNWQHKCQH